MEGGSGMYVRQCSAGRAAKPWGSPGHRRPPSTAPPLRPPPPSSIQPAPPHLAVLLLGVGAARQQRRDCGGVHVSGSHVQRRVAWQATGGGARRHTAVNARGCLPASRRRPEHSWLLSKAPHSTAPAPALSSSQRSLTLHVRHADLRARRQQLAGQGGLAHGRRKVQRGAPVGVDCGRLGKGGRGVQLRGRARCAWAAEGAAFHSQQRAASRSQRQPAPPPLARAVHTVTHRCARARRRRPPSCH